MTREIKLDEIKGHNNEDSAWVIIHNDIYDLTKFLEEHPGGVESILEYAGKDGTQAFEDVAHSQDARELMVKFKIGTLPEDQRVDQKCQGGTLKWAIMALAGAIIIGVVLKKCLK